MSTSLLRAIQESSQDFEWYPTTDEMLHVVAKDIKANSWNIPPRFRDVLIGVLDIGAGDGRALRYFKEHCGDEISQFMGIEKSNILAKEWPGYVFPDGISDSVMLEDNWTPGEWREATFPGGVLFAAKVYMNGNMHLKFHRKFMGKLNVEAGRLLGWVTSRKAAEEEMGEHACGDAWGASFSLDLSNVKALAA